LDTAVVFLEAVMHLLALEFGFQLSAISRQLKAKRLIADGFSVQALNNP
jgi:hypothetical protein